MEERGEWKGVHELPPHLKRLHERQMRAIRAEREKRPPSSEYGPGSTAPPGSSGE